jgi:hypothetical protein
MCKIRGIRAMDNIISAGGVYMNTVLCYNYRVNSSVITGILFPVNRRLGDLFSSGFLGVRRF